MKINNELKIGLAVVLAGVVFYLGIRFLRDLPLFGQATLYHTELSNSNGLVTGNAVIVNGVGVGSITDVHVTLTGAHITFSVEKEVTLTEGTTASAGGFGFVSSVQLNLTLGPPDAPVYEPGSFIPSSTQSDLLTDLSDRAPAVLGRIDTVLTESNQAISAARDLLTGPESQMQQTLASIRNSADAFEAVLLAEQGSLQAVLKDIEQLSGTLESFAGDSLGGAATDLKEVLGRLSMNLDLLETTTYELNTLLTSINNGHGTLGKLVTDDSLYVEAHAASAALRRILENFEENPSQYLRHLRLIDFF